jgi:eukaryotic translation initiation factor 2-alpha kinase 4
LIDPVSYSLLTAFETAEDIRKTFHKPEGMPTIAIDVAPPIFDSLVKNSSWVSDEEAWKTLCSGLQSATWAYLQQIREVVLKRKSEEYRWILLYAVKEERMQLLQLG